MEHASFMESTCTIIPKKVIERYIGMMIRVVNNLEEFLLISTKVLTGKSTMSKIKMQIKNFQKI